MDALRRLQNRDGGWPNLPGNPSWTEPTAFAALAAQAHSDRSISSAVAWLHAAQRTDGGWPPEPGIQVSTWITSVVSLLGVEVLGERSYRNAIDWLVHQTGQEGRTISRLSRWISGTFPVREDQGTGWPWYPETHSWVVPTAIGILALQRAMRSQVQAPAILSARIDDGLTYLRARQCADGGWNYGTPRVLGTDAQSYPETTGPALLALPVRDDSAVRKACAWARYHLNACLSSEGGSWLLLALAAHAQLPRALPKIRPPRTVQQIALTELAALAVNGHQVFR